MVPCFIFLYFFYDSRYAITVWICYVFLFIETCSPKMFSSLRLNVVKLQILFHDHFHWWRVNFFSLRSNIYHKTLVRIQDNFFLAGINFQKYIFNRVYWNRLQRSLSIHINLSFSVLIFLCLISSRISNCESNIFLVNTDNLHMNVSILDGFVRFFFWFLHLFCRSFKKKLKISRKRNK